MKVDDRFWKRAAIISCLFFALTLSAISLVQAEPGGYAAAILDTEGLLGYWRFDGDSGTVGTTCTDATGVNNGTYMDGKDGSGTPLGYTAFNFATGAPIGEAGNVALDLNNFDACVDLGTVPGFASSFDGGYPGTTGATMEFWIKTDVTEYCKLMGMQADPLGHTATHFAINLNRPTHDGQIGVYTVIPDVNGNNGGGDYNTRVSGGPGLYDDEWHYVAITMGLQWGYENSTIGSQRLNMYVGTPGDTEIVHYTYPDFVPTGRYWGTAPDLLHSLYLGGRFDPSAFGWAGTSTHHYEGMVDEVALYSEALTLEVIQEHYLASFPSIPGDADRNFIVDDADAAILAAHWLQSDGVTWGDGDFNEDGWVNELDASILAANWQVGVASASVPEPTTLGLVFCAGMTFLLWRRRQRVS